MKEIPPRVMRWIEWGLILSIGLCVAIGMEAAGYARGAAAGEAMLPPAFFVAGATLALVIGHVTKRNLVLFAALAAIAGMYVFDALNLGFLDWYRASHGEEDVALAAFDGAYWRFIAPLSAAFASIATAIVMQTRAPF